MKTIKGKIHGFNLSPKGFYESFLLQDGERLIQINIPHDVDPDAVQNLAVGDEISITAEELKDKRPSHHPVYEWIQKEHAVQEGTVKQINYARHGEPNGAILETGEFLHLRPEGAKLVELKIGQKLSFEGEIRHSPAGHVVIEASAINGTALNGHKPKPKKAPHKHDA